MLSFFKNAFEKMCSVIAIFVFVAFTILGGVLGFTFGAFSGVRFFFILLGAILGFLVAMVMNIFSFGMIATIIDISDTENANLLKIMEIEKEIKKISASKQAESAALTASTASSDEGWVCTKCGTTNPLGTKICRSCGN